MASKRDPHARGWLNQPSLIDPHTETEDQNDDEDDRGPFARALDHRVTLGLTALILLLGLAVLAYNGLALAVSGPGGAATGVFVWDPFSPPSPTPTPQLRKEYIWAGAKLLAAEDAGADTNPAAALALWRKSTGYWYILTSAEGEIQKAIDFEWGFSGDKEVIGDFDGDGMTDFCVFRPLSTTWYFMYSSDDSFHAVFWGHGTDKPVAADYDGDGKSDIAAWRSSDQSWHIRRSSDNVTYSVPFGNATDKPAPADYDGDGKADISNWRGSSHTFYTILSSTGAYQYAEFGSDGDLPVSGDYDGDGKANYALRHGADWLVRNAGNTATSTTTWGQASDIPVQNDYDGDGKVDIAVWRDSNGLWIIQKSSTGQTRQDYWGISGDIPVPAYYRR